MLKTLIFAFVLILLAATALAISSLLTGKNRLKGSCGRRPDGPKGEECGENLRCMLCDPKKASEKKKESSRDD